MHQARRVEIILTVFDASVNPSFGSWVRNFFTISKILYRGVRHGRAGDPANLEEQLLANQQIMSTVRAQDVAISGTITLQLSVEIVV